MFLAADYPDLLVGLGQPDDAAVWRVDDERALVATTDFFTPVVDDPFTYGAIAAANSLSDIYAMGASPFLALNIAAFPPQLPVEICGEILRGGAEKAREAGVVIVGGHTIQDKEPKYGLVALGFTHPQKMMTKGGLKPGDVLILSKPIGTGVIATAIKAGCEEPEEAQEAIGWMLRLNRQASELALACGVAAATDITGFSLLGHAWEMASASGVGMRIDLDKVPFMTGARRLAEKWVFPGGAYDNAEFFKPHVEFRADIPQETRLLMFDPQTSGGLLFGVKPQKEFEVIKKAHEQGLELWKIGEVTELDKVIVQ